MDGNSRAGPSKETLKEVKVKIPLSYHIRLHSMKVLTGKPISDAVAEALQRYFEEEHVPDPRRAHVEPSAEIHGVPELT